MAQEWARGWRGGRPGPARSNDLELRDSQGRAASARGVLTSGGQPRGGTLRSKQRRPMWFDPRFAIGLALVAASVLAVMTLVAAADSSIEVLAARGSIAPGERVTADDLSVASVRLDDAGSLYLTPDALPADGVVVTRPLSAGELVPAAAGGSAAGTQLTSVVLSVNSALPASVSPGSRVDVWSAREGESGVFDAPTVIVSSAIVVRLVEDGGLMVNEQGSRVEVLIPRFTTARVLEAVANGAAVSVIPVDLPLGD